MFGLNYVIPIVLVSVLGGGYFYVTGLQEDVERLTLDNSRLNDAVTTAENSIDALQESAERNDKLNKALVMELQKAEQYGDELRATLQKHNLTMLALKKPALIEKRMNDATQKLWADITADTVDDGVQSIPEPATTDSGGDEG